MRIAMVAHSGAPWTPRYARHFTERGHAVTVVSFEPGVVEGIPTVSVGGRGASGENHKWSYITGVPKVRRVLRGIAPDCVLATYVISDGLTAALSWRGPLIVSARGGDVLNQPGNPPIPGWLRNSLTRFICGRAAMVHAVSEEVVEALTRAGVPADRIVCFPMGVDLELFRSGEAPQRGTGTPHLVCTRTHGAVYHNDLIVEALARLQAEGRNVRCTFVGGGPLLPERREHAARLHLSHVVRFVEEVDHRQVPDLLRSADIYVSASSSDGTSSSLLEALACGLIPVVSRIRANEAWVHDGETGFLFTVGDARDLARAIDRALESPEVRERAKRENPLLVRQRGDQRANGDRLLALLANAAGPNHRARKA